MTKELIKNNDGTVSITVTVDGEEWEKAQKKAFNKFRSNLNMKGFRKGQMPAAVAKRYIPDEAVFDRAVGTIVNPLFNQIREEEKLQVVGTPSYNYDDASADSVKIIYTVPVQPEPVLGQYEHLGIEKDAVEVSDEDVENSIKDLQSRESEWVLIEDETPAKEGDQISISFKGEIDGEPIGDSDEAEDMTVIIGSGNFLKEFEEKLAGTATGEHKDFSISFPKEYMAPNLAGKTADFHVDVNEIRTKILPEVNDEFVADLGIEGVETADQLKDHVRKNLESQRENNAETKYINELLDQIVQNSDFVIPSAMIDTEVESMYKRFAENIQRSGYTVEDYLSITNSDPESIKERLRPEAIESLNRMIIVSALLNEFNIEVTNEDIEEEYKKMTGGNEEMAEKAKKVYAREKVAENIALQKLIDKLKSVQ